MTECQGCGAWNDNSRALCVLCGTPLAETDEWDAAAELPPLPPLPDGGLSASMPAWLREAPQLAVAEPPRSAPSDAAPAAPAPAEPGADASAPPLPALAPLGPRADPRLFLSDDDFPPWLHALAARRAAAAATETDAAPPAPVVSPPDAVWPAWPGSSAPIPRVDDAPPAAALPPAAVVAARAREERRARSPWETLLLIILFIGVVVAALWALVSNGVFSPGV